MIPKNETVLLVRICNSCERVTIFLRNGYQLHGTIAGHNEAMVIINDGDNLQCIYKHAISTITVARY